MIMLRKRIIFITLFYIFFLQGMYTVNTTYLSRICEFDAENSIGLKASGSFIITAEHISYLIDENMGLDVSYRYKIKKISQTENNTFALSLRNHGQFWGGLVSDEKLSNLKIVINNNNVQPIYTDSPYEIIDDDFNMLNPNYSNEEEFDTYFGISMSNGYIGWYYFTVDFGKSEEAEIVITYKTLFGYGYDDGYIQYNSRPFWLPISENGEIKLTIENNRNQAFLSSITDCEPQDTLVTKNWKLEKPKQNTVIITYTAQSFFYNKGFYINFADLYESRGSPNHHFFEISKLRGESGIIIYRTYYSDNISDRELKPYEFIFLNAWQLRVMRNIFYAKYRYRFRDNTLNELFYLTPNDFTDGRLPADWFNNNFTEADLLPIERKNIEIIQRLEQMVQ